MGCFGYGPLDGDDGMNLRDELFYFLGIDDNPDVNRFHTTESIQIILKEKQDEIYDWLRDYDWTQYVNAGNMQQYYMQATAQLFLNYNVKISERGKKGLIPFIENDYWAEENIERAKEMSKLLKKVKGS